MKFKHIIAGFLILSGIQATAQVTLTEILNEAQKGYNTASNTLSSYEKEFANWSNSAGQSFTQYVQSTEGTMREVSDQIVQELENAVAQLQSISDLKCDNYMSPVLNQISNINTPLDSYSDGLVSVATCKTCITKAVQGFICKLPEIFEGNVALMQRIEGALANTRSSGPAGAMASLVYEDFASSLLYVLETKDKMIAQSGITLTSNGLQQLYSGNNCEQYGEIAVETIISIAKNEKPTTRAQKITNKLLLIIKTLDATGSLDEVLAKKEGTSQQLPAAPSMSASTEKIGTGWGDFIKVFASNNHTVYGIKANGDLYSYQYKPGSKSWAGGQVVGSGWNVYTKVFTGVNGTVYGIASNGDLYWYKHTNVLAASWQGRSKIGSGWQDFKHVDGTSDGMIYATNSNGELLIYRHDDNGNPSFHEGSGDKIGTGWGASHNLLLGENGIIFNALSNGDLYWYMNIGFGDNFLNNGYGLLVSTNWNNFTHVFGGKDNVVYGIKSNGDLHRLAFN